MTAGQHAAALIDRATQLEALWKGAALSADLTYRYGLWRRWGDRPGTLTWVMLNPSTANADLDDPTIRRCRAFTAREGFDGMNVVNLYALRATDPRALSAHPDPVGPENDAWLAGRLAAARSGATKIVCAWGAGAQTWRANAFRIKASAEGAPLWCLGKTKDGHPRHPLYLKADAPLEVWP